MFYETDDETNVAISKTEANDQFVFKHQLLLFFEYLLLLSNKENLNNSLKQSIAAALLNIIQKLSLTVRGEHSRLQ